ncbi:DUF1223 domain-containing protein [Pedobacter hiemivivus]|uniref:DUF1223 domain-containing protein n=1 Tax=Pedobacter hiemivivus TaxID=2530454 RepID=A0A4U1GD48_9SPHI|nr:DUF1223 domain-containing protein [Pedobacter hiemivivus]TKC59112.1 DUF1223 domain-containing protein [Pedobacter hiemivivus]
MKTFKILGVISGLFMAGITAYGQSPTNVKRDVAKGEGKGFAVLELFTSEGCSSCPPADDLMARLQQEAAGKAIYLLAYHVDYWDRQGWKDTFSNAAYSERQRQYGEWLNKPQIYTPQVIVNGKAEFIGSEESTARHAIAKQLNTHSSVELSIQAKQENNHLNVLYKVVGAPKGSALVIAVVQKTAHSKVTRGENAGRSLAHVQIVRKLQIQSLNSKGMGTVSVALPQDFDTQNFEILGMVQNINTGEILRAVKPNE